LFIQTEVGFNAIMLSTGILGYIYGGLTGVGISYLIYYIIYLVGIKIVTKRKYNFEFNTMFYKVFLACIVFCFSSYLITLIETKGLKNILLIIMIVSSSIFSVVKLNKKTNLIADFRKRLNNNKD